VLEYDEVPFAPLASELRTALMDKFRSMGLDDGVERAQFVLGAVAILEVLAHEFRGRGARAPWPRCSLFDATVEGSVVDFMVDEVESHGYASVLDEARRRLQ
jgi:hypothetical protein